MANIEIKENDIVEFLAISWDEPHWEFDYPTVLLKPVLRYSPNGEHPESMIEDEAINLSIELSLEDEEDLDDEFEWRGWKLATLRKVARRRLAGHDDWKTKIREVLWQKITFIADENGELQMKILETKKA